MREEEPIPRGLLLRCELTLGSQKHNRFKINKLERFQGREGERNSIGSLQYSVPGERLESPKPPESGR